MLGLGCVWDIERVRRFAGGALPAGQGGGKPLWCSFGASVLKVLFGETGKFKGRGDERYVVDAKDSVLINNRDRQATE